MAPAGWGVMLCGSRAPEPPWPVPRAAERETIHIDMSRSQNHAPGTLARASTRPLASSATQVTAILDSHEPAEHARRS